MDKSTTSLIRSSTIRLWLNVTKSPRWTASIACHDLGRRRPSVRDALQKGPTRSFSQDLGQLAKPIWDAQLNHPFVVALGNGTLSEQKFKYYILQDARFLGELARVFAAGAVRSPDAESALRFNKLAEDTIVVERSLHENYG